MSRLEQYGLPAAFILIVLCFAAGLAAKESDAVTLDKITAAVAACETGVIWQGPGIVSGRFVRGSSGETGPWQAMPYTVRELGRSPARNASSARYAEYTFRLWYARLLSQHGTHEQALRAYHRGSGGIHRADAKEYAQRVLNYAGTL